MGGGSHCQHIPHPQLLPGLGVLRQPGAVDHCLEVAIPWAGGSQPIAWRKEPKVIVTAGMRLETRLRNFTGLHCAPRHPGGTSLGGCPGLPHLPGPVQMHRGSGRGRPCPSGLRGAHAMSRPVAGPGDKFPCGEGASAWPGRMDAGPRPPPPSHLHTGSLLGLRPQELVPI